MARGGKREGAGRPPGAVNKATAEFKDIAGEYTEECLGILMEVARGSSSDAARVAAVNGVLDRALGKPKQAVDANVTGSLTVNIIRFSDANDKPAV
ncbi:MAG: hypothetical protein A4E20_04700 [Nitrospira sp. SG-bin2]|uniref:hypothetical protein n=1 Tax=Nitrospira cf. moscoviensis SBR1015 TaxID=96242 RepID=UPI000A0A28D2|nr:hypothetical protein [Nitrospira cf. moscoviensis SBR1015]OQW38076.1 MAG: hypothetical protein A4E20_04700 [Nitrospira sp. SG-bin2]